MADDAWRGYVSDGALRAHQLLEDKYIAPNKRRRNQRAATAAGYGAAGIGTTALASKMGWGRKAVIPLAAASLVPTAHYGRKALQSHESVESLRNKKRAIERKGYERSKAKETAMSKSERNYLISKSDRKMRDSVFAGFNPRSHTQVEEGTGTIRGFRGIGGYLGGQALGGLAGMRGGTTTQALTTRFGGHIGRSLGRSANLHSGDTQATHRKTGRKAKYLISTPFGQYYTYEKPKG